jgi:PhzF family phenazine biosynthesis protein
MNLKIYQIDAFTDKVFHGNPAAVCITSYWLEDDIMQKIAAENNLAETAFVVKKKENLEIRWFTPTVEVDLCGHATLASAYVLYKYYDYKEDRIKFQSIRSGELFVNKEEDDLTLDFPTDVPEKCEIPIALRNAFGIHPIESYKGNTDYLLVFKDQNEIENLKPDMEKIASVGRRGVIVTAPGDSVDFVSRFFAPQSGINEDPVTGSAHTTLTPFWAKKYAKSHLTAKQVSKRGGYLACELSGNRVKITGQAVTYLIGEIEI